MIIFNAEMADFRGELNSYNEKRPETVKFQAFLYIGAGNEIRTRDPNLGKVVLYQLSYSRIVKSGLL